MRKLIYCKTFIHLLRKIRISCLILVFIFCSLIPLQSIAQTLEVTEADYYQHASEKADSNHSMSIISDLCSHEFTGRQSGTEGCEKAATYISSIMEEIDLVPSNIDKQGSYYQSFPVPYIQINQDTECSFSLDDTYTFHYKSEFYPYIKSDSGSITAPVVFAGYGIEMESYNDYEGIDVENKIVVILRDNPVFLDSVIGSRTTFDRKIFIAKKNKASGILILDIPDHKNPLQFNRKTVYNPGKTKGILAGFLTNAGGNQLFTEQQTTVKNIISKIISTKKPHSFDLKGSITLSIHISREERETSNVIGYIPAENESNKSLLVTAHYDHLGQDSVNKDFFLGANDNASGVSVVLECARVFKSLLAYSDTNIVFIAFSGEEEGLIGSKWYTRHPLFPLENIQAVINLDMVGTGDSALIAGTDPSVYTKLGKSINTASDHLSIPVDFSPRGLMGGSDQYYFHLENVPSVFFWRSGKNVWETYHTIDDTIDIIIENNIKETVQICLFTMLNLVKPQYVFFPTTPPSENVHPRLLFEGIGTKDSSIYINNKKYTSNYKGLLKTIYEIESGASEITFSTKNSTGMILGSYTIIINSKPVLELSADLDYNYVVNIEDLVLFSRVYPSDTTHNWLSELADINSDTVVDSKDFTLLSDYFGYQFET